MYDLPIAVGVLLMQSLIRLMVSTMRWWSVNYLWKERCGIRVAFCRWRRPRANGFKRIFVPASDVPEAALIPDIEVYPVSSLRDLYLHLTN